MATRSALIVFCFGLSAFAQQQQPAAIDFTQKLHAWDGQEIRQDKEHPVITLGDVAVMSLETWARDETPSGEEKFQADELARKIYQNRAAILTIDERKLIKDRIGKVEPPAIVGAAWPLLDPALGKKKGEGEK